MWTGSRLQLGKLLDHVFTVGHVSRNKTKIVFKAHCNESMNLFLTGALLLSVPPPLSCLVVVVIVLRFLLPAPAVLFGFALYM